MCLPCCTHTQTKFRKGKYKFSRTHIDVARRDRGEEEAEARVCYKGRIGDIAGNDATDDEGGGGERQDQTPGAPKLRDAARGAELIAGTVRQRGKKGYVAGRVTGFEGREYDVRFSSGQQVKWSEEEVRHGRIDDQYIMRRGWTAQDQKTL
jgi:hypothetical protein